MTLFRFKAKNDLSITVWSSLAVGWSSLRCKAVTSPSMTCSGTTIVSLVALNGSALLTTKSPSLAIVTLFK